MQLSNNDEIAITEWAKACPLIAEVWLYGSRAKGNSRNDSDIDLAVITVGDTVGGRLAAYIFEVAGWRKRLKLSSEVHLNQYDPEAVDTDVSREIERDCILIYKR